MPDKAKFKPELPGYVGTGLLILTTSLWAFWGVAEMYYEGWGAPFPAPLAYLIPAALCLTLTLVALTWPRLGGWVIILLGTAFTAWWWVLAATMGTWARSPKTGATRATAIAACVSLEILLQPLAWGTGRLSQLPVSIQSAMHGAQGAHLFGSMVGRTHQGAALHPLEANAQPVLL